MALNDDWLDQTREEALEPDLPICDTHHHLWDFGYEPPTRTRGASIPNRYLLDELLADLASGHNVVSTVFLECESMYRASGPEELRPVGETEFVAGIAAMCESGLYGRTRVGAGIIGFADLTRGAAARKVLEAHIAAGGGRFRGIRHSGAWDPSPDIRVSHKNPGREIFLDETFRAGFACLAPLGLSFDAWCYHPQIPDVTALARAFPETTIILNHFGGPLGIGPYADKRDDYLATWQADIAELASCPNVNAKLGGLNMKVNGFGWHKQARPPTSEELAAATGSLYTHVIECFGAERCMFESNFPVDKTSCGYGVLWNAFKRIAGGGSAAEKALLFRDTAERVYRLSPK